MHTVIIIDDSKTSRSVLRTILENNGYEVLAEAQDGEEGFEKYHFKAAIPARNRYLVDNAAYALCYVTHGWGGAAQTLERAQKNGLTIINLGA